jgi:probable F420-dependent oxidoreductase
MRLHAVLPNESTAVQPERIVELAVLAEEYGIDTVWLPDHLLPPEGYGQTYGGVYEPLVTLTAIASATRRVRLGTSVLVLPMRNPFVVAKQTATLDRLSRGRVLLGVGIGWDDVEFGSVGADFATRARRTDEAIRLLRHLFDVGHGPFEGEHYAFDAGVFEPRPTRHLPIVVGGNSDGALRRAARLADGWQSVHIGPDVFARKRDALRRNANIETGARAAWDETGLEGLVRRAHDFDAAGADYLAVSLGEIDAWATRLTAFTRAMRGKTDQPSLWTDQRRGG